MPRFRRLSSDVRISVSEDRATLLDRHWVPLDVASGGTPEPVEFSSMTVSELRDEIRRRNTGRPAGERLALTGAKAELVAALEADG